jgi:formylglycine-generating enzyme required for sulfatase activity
MKSLLLAAFLLLSLAAPGHAAKNPDGVAVIIGNKTYQGDIPTVDYAHNDADAIKRYVLDVLGYDPENLIDLRDASKAEMEAAFGNKDNHKGRLWQYLDPEGGSDILIYYSGHGVPGQNDQRSYMLPANADPAYAEINGYPLDVLYKNLGKLKARSKTVLIDACFSGASPKGMLIDAASPVFIKAKQSDVGEGITVLTAASGDQLASWDKAAKHGLFTNHFLDAVYGKGDVDGDGRVTAAEIKNYLDDKMTRAARRTYRRIQEATLMGEGGSVLASYTPGRPFKRARVVALEPASPQNPQPQIKSPALKQQTTIEEQKPFFAPVQPDDPIAKMYKEINKGYEELIKKEKEESLRSEKEQKRMKEQTDHNIKIMTEARIGRDEELQKAMDDFKLAKEREKKAKERKKLIRKMDKEAMALLLNLPPTPKPAFKPDEMERKPGDTFKDCPDCPEMVVIPPGSFIMGANSGLDRVKPVHGVTINYSFAVGKYEVTQAQWQSIMGLNLSYFRGDDKPVDQVTWKEVKDFTRKLSAISGEQYRLLSEAEWEYMAVAGSSTKYPWGEHYSRSQTRMGFNGNEGTVAVGSYAPNAFGIYDTVGNLSEWVEDCFNKNYKGAPTNGEAWTTGNCFEHISRGGSWTTKAHNILSSPLLFRSGADYPAYYKGFRIARDL